MTNLAEQASKLLDFEQKLDITLLDSIVGCMYAGVGEQVRHFFWFLSSPSDKCLFDSSKNWRGMC